MTVSFARVPTRNAGQYLASLANNARWNGLSVFQDNAHALIPLPFATCSLAAADDFLEITITAASLSDAALIEDAVSDRLDGVTNEELRYYWIVAP